jgi:hypothetical protein
MLDFRRYRDYLETVVPGIFEEVPLAVKKNLWFQQYGVLAHYTEDNHQWL